MPKTYEEIDSVASQMKAAGAPDSDIQQYVSLAMKEMEAPAPQAAPVAPPPQAVQGPSLESLRASVSGLSGDAARANMDRQMSRMAGGGTDMAVQGGMQGAGAKLGSMVPGPAKVAAIPILSGAGSVAGYVTNQLRNSEPITMGGITSSGLSGAAAGFMPSARVPLDVQVPFVGPKSIPKSVVLPASAAANAAINAGAANAENYIDRGQLLSPSESAIPALMGAGGTYVGNALDKGRIAKEQRAKSKLDTPNEAYRQKIIAEGGAFSPVFENESATNTTLGKIAKSSALTVDLQRKNVEWRNAKIRGLLGEPETTNLGVRSEDGNLVAIEKFRSKQNEVYKTIDEIAAKAQADKAEFEKPLLVRVNGKDKLYLAGMDKATLEQHADLTRRAAIDTKVIQELQDQEKTLWKAAREEVVPEGRAKLRDQAKAKHAEQEKVLDDMNKTIRLMLGEDKGKAAEASEVFENARKNLAMSHVLEDAIDARGNVDPAVIYADWKAGRKLTGPLLDIAKFYEFDPRVNKLPTMSHADARSGLGWAGIVGTAGVGAGAGGGIALKMGMSPGVATAVGGAAGIASLVGTAPAAAALRGIMASKFYQSRMTTPNYGSNIPDYLAYSARSAISAEGLDAIRKYEAKKFDAKNPSPLKSSR